MFIDNAISFRKNQTLLWSGSDNPKFYKPTQPDGQANYRPEDFAYTFNSDGFRCDEFTSEADIRILFVGCSYTEGIGLPVSEIWPTYILNKIRVLPENQNKKIPFFTVAVGGSSVDAMARRLVQYIDVIKPTHIIFLVGHFLRREYCFQSNVLASWTPNQPEDSTRISLSHICSDEHYGSYQAYRSLIIISQASKLASAKVNIFYISAIAELSRESTEKIISEFKDVKFTELHGKLPKSPTDHLAHKPLWGRDGLHRGAAWQYVIGHWIWNVLASDFSGENSG